MNTLIIEDEKLSADRIKKIIAENHNEINILGEVCSVKEALAFLDDALKLDLIIADIQLSDGLVFEVFYKYELNIPVIITTAFSEYAIQAIKLSALDYILKPVGPKELNEAILKAKKRATQNDAFIRNSLNTLSHNLNQSNTQKRIVISDLNGCYVININDILRCRSEKNYTLFYLSNGKTIIASKTLKEYETILSGSQFVRIHKSCMINLLHVTQYLRGEGGSVILTDGSEEEVSRRKKVDLLSVLSDF